MLVLHNTIEITNLCSIPSNLYSLFSVCLFVCFFLIYRLISNLFANVYSYGNVVRVKANFLGMFAIVSVHASSSWNLSEVRRQGATQSC